MHAYGPGALVLGWLFTQGLVASPGEVQSLGLCADLALLAQVLAKLRIAGREKREVHGARC